MPISKAQIEALFSVGDVIPCFNGGELHIISMLDDHIKLISTETNVNEISIDYSMLSDTFDAFYNNPSDNPMSLFHSILAEYNKRAEQARRDEEVDAMWAGAMVCELP